MQTVDLASGATHNTALRADESPRQFSTDGKTVVGTTDSRFFGAAVVNGAMDSPVTIADSDSLDVYKTAVAGNDVYITDYEGVIKYSTLDSSTWTVRPFGYVDTDFRARELASDGVDLCVITYSLEIACAKLATGLETWETYPGQWQAIAVANNTLTAVASSNFLFV
ncbi:hypothetical protein SPRG_21080 [Saprolegnia parasitica CBS 223.65]|uniref:Uncharacterized protein n=1 Tax=Saprolegnia parasitica (strain CBS 223.65) TaxID=695850 RepID=A0A067C8L6_SAPPC|nr:hypothetical protein SPRG_21080 [Saprolegnia parasitica CBS 223.65]KDO22886.1 hypothetical protein SPRG_21080 [Saprolegnia parasitica CBS 223.65]|eukprot:XP_012206453.1 hypothetical protein SPRG_21080 [Saprolegnia parasitica CBS 223.65]